MRALSILALFLTATASAQAPSKDWRMPFRSPETNLEPPLAMYEPLRVMRQLARSGKVPMRLDDEGIEVSDDPEWRRACQRLLETRQDAGYLSLVIRESASVEDRAVAFYGAFYQPDPAQVMALIAHIPGEPVRELREEAYRRALDFLRVHLPKVNAGDAASTTPAQVGPAGVTPPKPGEHTYQLDLEPFVALLRVDDPTDRAQGMWFLGEVVRIRPDLADDVLAAVKAWLPELLVAADAGVRAGARSLLALLDPKHRAAPPADATAEAVAAWHAAVMYDVFPPIRPVAPGLTELWPSEDLERVVEVGQRVLLEGSLGDPWSGRLRDGGPYRGLRIAKVPEPLEKLGLEVDQVVTAINGSPVATCAEVLALLKSQVGHRTSFLVEFVAGGRAQAREFRRRSESH
jgi:hypothetical protein